VTAVAAKGAEGVRWDLSPLAPSEQAMKERLERAVVDASSFIDRWPVASIEAIEPPQLTALLRELGELRAAHGEAERWAMLLAWTDGENPSVLDVQAWVGDRLPRFDEAIRHFELAWIDIPDERARELARHEGVAQDRHYLLSLRRFGPFMLSPAEERVLSAREASASTAWKSLRDRTLGALTASFDDGAGEREWALSELESLRAHPDRDVRRRAADTVRNLVEPCLPVLAQCYDALVADRLAVDGLRGHADPMEQRNLESEIEGDVVEGLLAVAEAHYELGHRWFDTKARLLGLAQLDTIDLFASAVETPSITWDEGRRLSVGVFAGLTPAIGREAERFFDERRIDAEPRRGKPYGAFCVWPSTRVPGFALVNWSGQLRDLVMLTHELGHGTHFGLAARVQSDNSFMPGLTVAEVPSTFAQLRLVDQLWETDAQLGRAALARTLDEAVSVAFLATALARYEQKSYALRADGQALTAARLNDFCDAELAKVWGDAVTDEQGSRRAMWASFPHFVHERFYTYAYVFAFLLAAGLLPRSREPGFDERYERFLAAGGSAAPEELFGILDVDLGNPGIWESGFAVMEEWLDRMR
jgi:oligoendopeptidase F